VESDSVRVTARKVVLAAGSRARIPPIPGLSDTPYLTNETVFELTERPRRLIVLGGGPIGMELGQAFRRLGSEVVVVEAGELLGREDRAAAEVVIAQMRSEGVEFVRGKAAKVETRAGAGAGGRRPDRGFAPARRRGADAVDRGARPRRGWNRA
jgi:pyruvate/2-oxoglutarate dehydrogenase complex dihydrolipoamide dehydrogenase (E3) component